MVNRNQRKDKPEDVTIRDAELRYLNFEGRETKFKEAGNRSFRLMLPDDVAQEMAALEWNVKQTKPRQDADEEEFENFEPRYYLDVALSYKYDNLAPQVQLITSESRTLLSEAVVGIVDTAEIIKADIIINASRWNSAMGTGIKAYLKRAYITIQEDDLEREYSHIPLAGATPLTTPGL